MNEEQSLINMMQKKNSLGSNIPIQSTPVFDPANESRHEEIDYEELEK